MTQPDIKQQVYADKAVELINELGETIEKLNDLGCIVSLEIWFNDGSESMNLHKLNGEFGLEVGVYASLTQDETSRN